MQAAWPGLTQTEDYEFCNALGAEAVKAQLDALLAPSVRHPQGTNVAVFARRAMSNPGERIYVAATYNPATGTVSMSADQQQESR